MQLLDQTIAQIGSLDKRAMDAALKRLNSLTKPPGSLGMLEEIALKLSGITGEVFSKVDHKMIIVMAGDHGVVSEGVAPFPQEVTRQMVYNFLNGGAAINVLARQLGAAVKVVDVGIAGEIIFDKALALHRVKSGTDNIVNGPAMSRQEAINALEVGINVAFEEINKGAQIIACGDMGIGNTTPSSAIVKLYSSLPLKELVGPGTGLTSEKVKEKVKIIERALEINKPEKTDAVDVLAKVGGLEIGGLAGIVLGCAARRVPVVIDGLISGAAALIANGICPRVKDFMFGSHVSAEPGHKEMLRILGLNPPLNMGMRLGEGTGGVLAMYLIEAAARIMGEMATFEEAGVSQG